MGAAANQSHHVLASQTAAHRVTQYPQCAVALMYYRIYRPMHLDQFRGEQLARKPQSSAVTEYSVNIPGGLR